MMKSELVVNASLVLLLAIARLGMDDNDLPADAVLIHLPARAVLAIEDMIGVINIQFQRPRNVPLVVILPRWWCRNEAPRQDFVCVLEDLPPPPLELAVLCGRQAADKGSILSVVALDTDWHILEALVRLLVERSHTCGDATSNDPVFGTELAVSGLLRSLLKQSSGVGSSRKDDVGC